MDKLTVAEVVVKLTNDLTYMVARMETSREKYIKYIKDNSITEAGRWHYDTAAEIEYTGALAQRILKFYVPRIFDKSSACKELNEALENIRYFIFNHSREYSKCTSAVTNLNYQIELGCYTKMHEGLEKYKVMFEDLTNL